MLTKLNGIYSEISTLLRNCRSGIEEIEREHYEKPRETEKRKALMTEANSRLKAAFTDFFEEYESLKERLDETEAASAKIDRLPCSDISSLQEKPDSETAALRRIEGILERQEFISKLERLKDEDVYELYKNTLTKAERIRKSLIEKTENGELSREEAERILRIDSNVRIVSMMEDSDYPVTGRNPLQNALTQMTAASMHKRSADAFDPSIRRQTELLHSSVCFLLRDLSENNLKVRDWQGTENIIDDPNDKQVEFFLSQSEKHSSAPSDRNNSASENDILSI